MPNKITATVTHARKSLGTLLREAGLTPTSDGTGALGYVVEGEFLTPGQAAKKVLSPCDGCAKVPPFCPCR